jgi:hypothetical protein
MRAPLLAISEIDTSLAGSSSVGGEREFKIGAAGELFVSSFQELAPLSNLTDLW